MHRSFLPITIAAVCIALSVFHAASPRAALAEQPTMAVDVDPTTPGVQQSLVRAKSAELISVDVVIQNASAVGAFDLEVIFDSQALALQSWVEGPFLGSTGRKTGCVPISAEHSFRLGCVTYGAVPPPGASGSGVLVTLNFSDVHASATCIVLTLAQTATVDGDPLPADHQNGCLTVISDTDGDGVADISDNCPEIANADQKNTDAANTGLYLPGADGLGDACDDDIDGDGYSNAAEIALGKSPITYCRIMRADLDGDGRVSLLDITLLVQRYMTSIPPAPVRYEQGSDHAIGILDLAAIAEVFISKVSACP